MTDFERMYANLAEEVGPVMLTSPADLRRKADRRMRIRLAATAAVVAALVGGIAVGGQWVLRAGGSTPLPEPGNSATVGVPTPTPAAAPSPTVQPSPSVIRPPDKPVPTQIPERAFLQLADTNGDVPPELRPDPDVLPSLCGATYPSDSDIAVRRATFLYYWAKTRKPGYVPDGTFTETITAYRSNGAIAMMTELEAAVTACPTENRNNNTYRYRLISPPPSYGDDSLLIEVRYPTRDPEGSLVGGDEVRLISVVRRGQVVMTLYEQGYEAGWSADRSVVNTFTRKAMTRLDAWLE
jgi:hypothetical protein